MLDGMTIFRFAHMWREASSGGVEACLRSLNQALLRRNSMRILQMHLRGPKEPHEVEVERFGHGEIIWIPSVFEGSQQHGEKRTRRLWEKIRSIKRNRNRVRHDILFSNLRNYRVDLTIFHWISEDSKTVLSYLKDRQVRIAVVNHFQNSRLKRPEIRKQIVHAQGIGGVSDVDLPRFLKGRFTNLSDGIDTDFFDPAKSAPAAIERQKLLVLLPGRLIMGKGHFDAVEALVLLAKEGVRALLAFAGKTDNGAFVGRVRRLVAEKGLEGSVIFLGELPPEDIRSWYAVSDMIILPSYSEGLGRVLLEAQAMERPVVAYDVGGVREAVRDGEGGFLVKKGDVRGLARRSLELLNDREERIRMGMRGRRYVTEKFSLDALAVRHEAFYLDALNGSKTKD
jgi:glycosyltransferase involved in cell wall biosynthesis